MARELPRNKEGKKMYPVCNWERNQHKIYNAHERLVAKQINDPKSVTPEEYDWVMRAYDAIDACVINGTVYATWEDGRAIKDLIAGYDFRH